MAVVYLMGQLYTNNYQNYISVTVLITSIVTYFGYLGSIIGFAKQLSNSMFMTTIVVILGVFIGIVPHILLLSGCILMAIFDIQFGPISYLSICVCCCYSCVTIIRNSRRLDEQHSSSTISRKPPKSILF
jgi:hypothetical protein